MTDSSGPPLLAVLVALDRCPVFLFASWSQKKDWKKHGHWMSLGTPICEPNDGACDSDRPALLPEVQTTSSPSCVPGSLPHCVRRSRMSWVSSPTIQSRRKSFRFHMASLSAGTAASPHHSLLLFSSANFWSNTWLSSSA